MTAAEVIKEMKEMSALWTGTIDYAISQKDIEQIEQYNLEVSKKVYDSISSAREAVKADKVDGFFDVGWTKKKSGECEGDICNRNGCGGTMVFGEVVGCTCHMAGAAPCSRCVDNPLVCDECGEYGTEPTEVVLVCVNNTGVEEFFDVGVEYVYERHKDPSMVYAYDKFGERREMMADRFTKK